MTSPCCWSSQVNHHHQQQLIGTHEESNKRVFSPFVGLQLAKLPLIVSGETRTESALTLILLISFRLELVGDWKTPSARLFFLEEGNLMAANHTEKGNSIGRGGNHFSTIMEMKINDFHFIFWKRDFTQLFSRIWDWNSKIFDLLLSLTWYHYCQERYLNDNTITYFGFCDINSTKTLGLV